MKVTVTLTPTQIQQLQPLLRQKTTGVLVGSFWPSGLDGWKAEVHLLPAERRDSIRAACEGGLRLPRSRKAKSPVTTDP